MSDDIVLTAKQKADALLVEALESDPATRTELYRLVKKKDPTRVIPEIDIRLEGEAATQAALKQALDANDELKKRVDQMDFERKLEKARAGVVASGLVSEDELPEVEKIITERHVDYQTAAELVSLRRENNPATPETYYRADNDEFGKVDFLADPDGAAETVANGLIDKFNKARPAGRSH